MKIAKIILFIIILSVLSQSTLAWFPNNHIYISLVALRTTNSPITELCEGRENLILTGMSAADIFVVHYLEGGTKIASYIGSHSKGFYERWMQLAGSDIDLKCMGYGIAFHMTQDQESHYGFVPEDITRFKLPNILIHPAREQQFEMSMLNDLETKGDRYSVTSYGEVTTLTRSLLDIFDEDPKYLDIFAKASGLREEDIKRDIDTVNINLKGNTWDEAVYGKKVSIPISYILWLSVFLVISIVYIYLVAKIGVNAWKFVGYFLGGFLGILTIVTIISVPLGTSWYWYQSVNKIPAKLIGYEDYKPHVDNSIKMTKQFLENENLIFKDASGLSYTIEGRKVDGALTKADKGFKIFVFPVIAIIVIVFNTFLFWIMSRKR